MYKLITFVLLCLSVGIPFVARGQVPERDYFTADDDPQARRDLNLNNEHHTDRVLKWVREGNIPMALEDVKFTLDKWPNHPRALILMEVIARLTHAPSLPILYYEKAINKYPQYAITHAQYGKYLVEIGQVEAGIAKLQHAIDLDPKLPAAHAWLAEAYYEQGKKQLARKSAEQARALGFQGELRIEPQSARVQK